MDASLALGFAFGLVLEGIVSMAVAQWFTRPRVKSDIQAERDNLLAALELKLAPLAPGAMRGGSDPLAMNAARWGKEQDRARTEVTILAHLADLLGPNKAQMAWGFIPKSAKDAALRAGENWQDVLDPLLDMVRRKVAEHMQNPPDDAETFLGVWGQR